MDRPEGDAPDETPDWSEKAKGLLKSQLKLRNWTYAHLVTALARVGVSETEANLRNKISRGNFSAAFLLQCLDVIGATVLYLDSSQVRTIRGKARVGKGVAEAIKRGQQEIDRLSTED